jgi:hypothetical protein
LNKQIIWVQQETFISNLVRVEMSPRSSCVEDLAHIAAVFRSGAFGRLDHEGSDLMNGSIH